MGDIKKLSKAYFEITNVCNLSCSFCPSNKRKKHFVTEDEFSAVLDKLSGKVDYLYFHLMGEPLLHPKINDFAILAKNRGFKVMITSNGVLAKEKGISLINTGAVSKISLSLHSYEANVMTDTLDSYLEGCFFLATSAKEKNTVCVFRLWNKGNDSSAHFTNNVIAKIKEYFGDTLTENRSGYKISEYIFLEFGDRFLWPGQAVEKEEAFCYALRNQIGILCDGTVVPCCLDAEGNMPLGNIYHSTLDEILSGDKARALYNSFTKHKAITDSCKKCGFSRRFL